MYIKKYVVYGAKKLKIYIHMYREIRSTLHDEQLIYTCGYWIKKKKEGGGGGGGGWGGGRGECQNGVVLVYEMRIHQERRSFLELG